MALKMVQCFYWFGRTPNFAIYNTPQCIVEHGPVLRGNALTTIPAPFPFLYVFCDEWQEDRSSVLLSFASCLSICDELWRKSTKNTDGRTVRSRSKMNAINIDSAVNADRGRDKTSYPIQDSGCEPDEMRMVNGNLGLVDSVRTLHSSRERFNRVLSIRHALVV